MSRLDWFQRFKYLRGLVAYEKRQRTDTDGFNMHALYAANVTANAIYLLEVTLPPVRSRKQAAHLRGVSYTISTFQIEHQANK